MSEKKKWQILFGLTLGAVAVAILFHGASFTAPFLRVARAAFPIVLSLGVAFLLGLPLSAFERLWVSFWGEGAPRLRRAICLFLVVLLALGALVLLGVAIIPALIRSLSEIISRLPEYGSALKSVWDRFSAYLAERSIALPPLSFDVEALGESLAKYIEENGRVLWRFSFGFVRSTVRTVWDGAIALVLAIYMLAGKERHASAVRRLLSAFVSSQRYKKLEALWKVIRDSLTRFVVGQSCEAVVLGVLCFVGMLLFGFPYAALISTLIGVSALIPIFGALLGTGVGALLIFLENPIDALWFVIFILVLQQIEGNLIYPRVVGRSVGLPGLWVLCAVTVGSAFGVVGMLLAVPLASVVYALLRDFAATGEVKLKNNTQ